MTPIYGITEGGLKKTGRDSRVLPKTVIYDPRLLWFAVRLSATSGMNAIAHAVEGLYAEDANPITSLLATEGIRALAQGLPRVVPIPGPRGPPVPAWRVAVRWRCSAAWHGPASQAVPRGGSFNLPHAETHRGAASCRGLQPRRGAEAMRLAAHAIGAEDAARGLYARSCSKHR
jgi:maleylacetate reductase